MSIVCFSGTGNTLAVARELARQLGDSITFLGVGALTHPSSFTVDTDDGRVVWAFPTYSWAVPPVIVNLIKGMKIGEGARRARHFMLTTCGDDMGRADRRWRGLIAGRGLEAAGAFAVRMPNTYVCLPGFDVDSPETVAAKLAAMPGKVAEIAGSIKKGGPDILLPGAFPWIKSNVLRLWFERYKYSARPFHADDRCNGCGTCSRECPMANISMDADLRPRWADRCAMCLRCYHACPRHAVQYGRATRGKGQQFEGIR